MQNTLTKLSWYPRKQLHSNVKGSEGQEMGIGVDTSFFPDSIELLYRDCKASDLACWSPAAPPGAWQQALGSPLGGSGQAGRLPERERGRAEQWIGPKEVGRNVPMCPVSAAGCRVALGKPPDLARFCFS
jgi:hypothetical protein